MKTLKAIFFGIVLAFAAVGIYRNAHAQGVPINCADSGGQHLNYLTATHKWVCGTTSSGSGAALSAITAATGAATIASGNNTGIVWNWANTSNTTIAFTFGETSAATNGTSTSGIPNQVLVKLTTLAASTQSPLSVYSRASHVFSVSPSAAQILAANGTTANPTYAFAAETNSGMYLNGAGVLEFQVAGALAARFVASQVRINNGSAATPGIANTGATDGIFLVSSTAIGFSVGTTEKARFTGGTNTALLQITAMTFANLGTPGNGNFTYCSDCTIANPCAGSGTGALAKRLNATWVCN